MDVKPAFSEEKVTKKHMNYYTGRKSCLKKKKMEKFGILTEK